MSSIDAIVEIAGRDSFVAALKFCREHPLKTLLPTVVRTGTEYGDFDMTVRYVGLLRATLAADHGVTLLDLIVLKDAELWWALNGRFVSLLFQRYGFYTPCIGCHLYVHLMRIPPALKENVTTIVSGERESHDAGTKLNQTARALAAYTDVLRSAGLELVLPVRAVTSSDELKSYAGWLSEEGEGQLNCVFSGNYRLPDGGAVCPPDGIEDRFYREFLIPAGTRIAASLASGRRDFLAIVADVLKERP